MRNAAPLIMLTVPSPPGAATSTMWAYPYSEQCYAITLNGKCPVIEAQTRRLCHLQGCIWDVVLPADITVLLWDLIMLLLIIYLCIALPYTVAFAIDFVS